MAYFRCGMGGGSSDNFDFIAPAFSTSETYNIDDLVIKDGSLYKCLSDNTTGSWNASKWEVTTLAESSSLDSNLGNDEIKNVLYINGNTTGTVPDGYKKSYFIPYRISGKYSAKVNNVEVMSDNNTSTFKIFEVNSGDTFFTTGSTGTRCSIIIQF